jgi:hypothetical protein
MGKDVRSPGFTSAMNGNRTSLRDGITGVGRPWVETHGYNRVLATREKARLTACLGRDSTELPRLILVPFGSVAFLDEGRCASQGVGLKTDSEYTAS